MSEIVTLRRDLDLERVRVCKLRQKIERQRIQITRLERSRVNLRNMNRALQNQIAMLTEAQPSENELHIRRLKLGTRAYNCLMRAGIETIPDLLNRPEEEIRAIHNMGEKTLGELMDKLVGFCQDHIDELTEYTGISAEDASNADAIVASLGESGDSILPLL